MIKYKEFFSNLIIIAFFLQLSGVILENVRFNRVCKTVSGIICTSLMLFLITGIGQNLTEIRIDSSDYPQREFCRDFTSKVSEYIQKDIFVVFGVNVTVKTETNMKCAKFHIYGEMNGFEINIYDYIKERYCTPEDEVIMHTQ